MSSTTYSIGSGWNAGWNEDILSVPQGHYSYGTSPDQRGTDLELPGPVNFLDTVTVLVGPERRAFAVLRTVLCQSSTFWDKALSDRLATLDGFALPMVEPDVFNDYLQCAYFGRVEEERSDDQGTHMRLARLYIFADKVGDEWMANRVIDRVNRSQLEMPRDAAIQLVYENTASGSLLRCLYLDIWLHRGDADRYATSPETFPAQFGVDLAVEWMRTRGWAPIINEMLDRTGGAEKYLSPSKRPCRYHKHSSPGMVCVPSPMETWLDTDTTELEDPNQGDDPPCDDGVDRNARGIEGHYACASVNGGQDHVGENHVGENHAGEHHVGENHVGENHVGENHIGENHVGENHVGENHAGQDEGATGSGWPA